MSSQRRATLREYETDKSLEKGGAARAVRLEDASPRHLSWKVYQGRKVNEPGRHAHGRGAFELVNYRRPVSYRPANSEQPVAGVAVQLVQVVAEFPSRDLEKGPVAVGEGEPFLVALVALLGIR
jgi:hypothetical protein